jgi:hypothetical protein
MSTKINNLFFSFILVCFLYGIGYVYWDESLTSTIFFIVSLVLGIMIILSKGFYNLDTYSFFRKHALIILILHLMTFFVNREDPLTKVFCLALDKAMFGSCFFWLILWFHHLRNNINNGMNSMGNQQLNRR